MFIKLIILLFFRNKSVKQESYLKNRLVGIRDNYLLAFLYDRLGLVYSLVRLSGVKFTFSIEKESDFYASIVTSEKVQQEAEYAIGKKLDALDVKNIRVSVLNCKFWLIYISNIVIALFSLFDLSLVRYASLSRFFRYRLALNSSLRVNELYLIGVHSPSMYALLSSLKNEQVYFVAVLNDPSVNTLKKHGDFQGVNIAIRNETHLKELEILKKKGVADFSEEKVVKVGNSAQLYLDQFDQSQKKYEIGFFTEGWWMRDFETGFSIEDTDKLNLHLETPLRFEAELEIDLLKMTLQFCKENKFKMAIYLHPCELRARENGICSPFEKFIDNDVCFYGEKLEGISNIFESEIAITVLPTASLITDRSEYGLKTIFLSPAFFLKQETDNLIKDTGFERLFYSPYDISCDSVEQVLDEIKCELAIKF